MMKKRHWNYNFVQEIDLKLIIRAGVTVSEEVKHFSGAVLCVDHNYHIEIILKNNFKGFINPFSLTQSADISDRPSPPHIYTFCS